MKGTGAIIVTLQSGLNPLNNIEVEEIFGKLEYVRIDNSHDIIISDEWKKEHFGVVFIPQLEGMKTYGGHMSGNIYCHRLIYNQLKDCFKYIEKYGFLGDILFWGGLFSSRMVRGSKTNISRHSYGIALDINPSQNGVGQEPAAEGEKGSVKRLVPIFEAHGFCWGGNFNRKDGMHFECCMLKR